MALRIPCQLLLPYGPLTELPAPPPHPAAEPQGSLARTPVGTSSERGQWLAAVFWMPASSARPGREGGRDGAVWLLFPSKQTPAAGSRPPTFARACPSSALPAQTPNPLSWAASSLAGSQAGASQRMEEEDGGSGVWQRPRRSPGQRRAETGRASSRQFRHAAPRSCRFSLSSVPDPGLRTDPG